MCAPQGPAKEVCLYTSVVDGRAELLGGVCEGHMCMYGACVYMNDKPAM